MKRDTDILASSEPRKVVSRVAKEGALLGWLAVSIYLLLALSSFTTNDPGWSTTGTNDTIENIAGPVGAWLADVLFSLFGYLAYLFSVIIVYWVCRLFCERHQDKPFDLLMLIIRFTGFLLLIMAGTGLMAIKMGNAATELPFSHGGILGVSIAEAIESTFGFVGATLLLLVMGLFGVTIFTDLSWLRLMDWLGGATLRLIAAISERISRYRQRSAERRQAKAMVKVRQENLSQQFETIAERTPPVIAEPVVNPEVGRRQQQEQQQTLFDTSLASELPPLHLLDQADQSLKKGYSEESLEAISRLLELKLKDFSIIAEVVSVLPGPVVTRFEIQPAPGIKVSRITNLAKDLARSLAVISVRVVEVIPGKSVVGIEMPNEHRQMVRLSEILASAIY